jgi:peptidyl-tRNA hydrolase, PTH1 family
MKLIVGLGNPGKDYEKTRHNAGFMVVDRLVQKHGAGAPVKARFNAAVVEAPIDGQPCLFMKPTTFMNRSGQCVADGVRFYKLDPAQDLLVISDEIALPAGTIRLRPGGGTAGHNGLANITLLLGTDAYPRLRVGIGPKPVYFDDQADFVLGRFTEAELPLVEPALQKAVEATEVFIERGLDAAMNQFNAPPPSERPARPKRPRPAETDHAETNTPAAEPREETQKGAQ